MPNFQPNFDLAIKAVEYLITNFGKDITFIEEIVVENKRDPSLTQITENTYTIRGLWRYSSSQSKSSPTITTEAGEFDPDIAIVTILAKDLNVASKCKYFVVNNVRYKIGRVIPAVGFETQTDRYYVIGEARKK